MVINTCQVGGSNYEQLPLMFVILHDAKKKIQKLNDISKNPHDSRFTKLRKNLNKPNYNIYNWQTNSVLYHTTSLGWSKSSLGNTMSPRVSYEVAKQRDGS